MPIYYIKLIAMHFLIDSSNKRQQFIFLYYQGNRFNEFVQRKSDIFLES